MKIVSPLAVSVVAALAIAALLTPTTRSVIVGVTEAMLWLYDIVVADIKEGVSNLAVRYGGFERKHPSSAFFGEECKKKPSATCTLQDSEELERTRS